MSLTVDFYFWCSGNNDRPLLNANAEAMWWCCSAAKPLRESNFDTGDDISHLQKSTLMLFNHDDKCTYKWFFLTVIWVIVKGKRQRPMYVDKVWGLIILVTWPSLKHLNLVTIYSWPFMFWGKWIFGYSLSPTAWILIFLIVRLTFPLARPSDQNPTCTHKTYSIKIKTL